MEYTQFETVSDLIENCVFKYTHKLSVYFTEFQLTPHTKYFNQASLMAYLMSQSTAHQLQGVCNTMCTTVTKAVYAEC